MHAFWILFVLKKTSDFKGHMRNKLLNLPFQMKTFVSFLNQTIGFQLKAL